MSVLLVNTLLLAVVVLAVVVPLGTVMAWLLARVDWPGRTAVSVLLTFLLFTPLYLQAAAWDAGFGRQGWFTFRAGEVASPLLRGWRAVIAIHVAHALPWVVLIAAAGFRQVESAFEEQALLDVPWWATLTATTLRRVAAVIGIAAAWVTVMVAGEMTVTDMYQVRTFAEELYTGLALGDDLSSVILQLTPGWLAIAALALMLLAGLRGWLPVRTALPTQATTPLAPGRARWPVAVAMWTIAVWLVAVPLGNLFYQAGLVVERVGGLPTRHWSFSKCLTLMMQAPWRFRDEWWGTISLATLSAALAMALAVVAAWWSRGGGWRAAVIFFFGGLGVATPGPLYAVVLLRVRDQWSPAWFDLLADRGLVLVAIVLAARSLPVCLAVCWQRFRAIPDGQLELATLDGVGAWRQLITVVLPQSRAALLATSLFAWALAAGDLTASVLLVPPGISTVPIRTFLLVHAGVDDRLASLTLVSAALFVALASAALFALRWDDWRTNLRGDHRRCSLLEQSALCAERTTTIDPSNVD